MNRQEASLFFRLVTHRYNRGAILITTNKSIREWIEFLAGDEVLATAILDRLLHHSHVLNIKECSYRLRDLEESLGIKNEQNLSQSQSSIKYLSPGLVNIDVA